MCLASSKLIPCLFRFASFFAGSQSNSIIYVITKCMYNQPKTGHRPLAPTAPLPDVDLGPTFPCTEADARMNCSAIGATAAPILLIGIELAVTGPAAAQAVPLAIEDMPLAQNGAVKRGGTVTPVYEGWYEQPDGSFMLYFGYYNRNTEEVVEVPMGPANAVDGPSSGSDAGQPTTFQSGRAWGVFGVEVPADFGDGSVVWTLTVNGSTVAIPGHLRRDWMVPAITGDAMNNLPPRIRFAEGGDEGFGPGGLWGAPREASVQMPVTVTVWASDDGTSTRRFRPGGRAAPVSLMWFKHRGPGEVHFDEGMGTVPNAGGQMSTRVTFSHAGSYILRVRATDDSGVVAGGNEQCCWTNGYLQFTVRP